MATRRTTMSERLPTAGFMMLDWQFLSDPDVRPIRRERQYLVENCQLEAAQATKIYSNRVSQSMSALA